MKQLTKEREDYKKRFMAHKAAVERQKQLLEQSERIRQNQQKLIEMQAKKIEKLKCILDVPNSTPPLLKKSSAELQKPRGQSRPTSMHESRQASFRLASKEQRASVSKRDSIIGQRSGSHHLLHNNRLGSKSPTMRQISPFLRRSSSSQSQGSIGRLSLEYQEFRARRDSQISEELARQKGSRRSVSPSFYERAEGRRYTHEDYEITERGSLHESLSSSPCRACLNGDAKFEDLHDSQVDLEPVRDSPMKKKHLEARRTYTLINHEHLSTIDKRMREEEALKREQIQVHESYEPISPPTNFNVLHQREIAPLPLKGDSRSQNLTENQSYMRREERQPLNASRQAAGKSEDRLSR